MRKIVYVILILFFCFQSSLAEGKECLKIKKVYKQKFLNKDYYDNYAYKYIYGIFYDTDKKKTNLLVESIYYDIEIKDVSIERKWVLIYVRQVRENPKSFSIKLIYIPEAKNVNIFHRYIYPQNPGFFKDNKGEFIAYKDFSVDNYVESKKYIINGVKYNKKVYFKDLEKRMKSFKKIEKEIEGLF